MAAASERARGKFAVNGQAGMKQKSNQFFQRYATALRKHLKSASRAARPIASAPALGRQAVALGLETLDLARMHARAVATLEPNHRQNGLARRAEVFFNEANTLLETTQRPAHQANVCLNRLKAALVRRPAVLASSDRQWQPGVVRRKVMADAAEKGGRQHHQCLVELRRQQKRLRQLTHRVLSAQEAERKKISRELDNEIAQTLFSLNVGLLAMKQNARKNTRGLNQEIASTQQLVAKSARSVRRLARELDTPQPAQNGLPAPKPGRKLHARQVEGLNPHPSIHKNHSALIAPAPTGFPVIAMAASVGGLKALSVILGGLPADFPAAIAIVMHLSPDHKSLLAEILNSRSHLTVKQAHTGDRLRPANVFIAPPNHHLFVAKDGRLKLSSSTAKKVHYARPSAEPLFASVAKVYQKQAIAVVLTGGDGDGSFGVQIIKQQGGQVIAQDRPTSQDFSMPETSIRTGEVDFILPLNEIAPKLIELVGAGIRPLPAAAMVHPRSGPVALRPGGSRTKHFVEARPLIEHDECSGDGK